MPSLGCSPPSKHPWACKPLGSACQVSCRASAAMQVRSAALAAAAQILPPRGRRPPRASLTAANCFWALCRCVSKAASCKDLKEASASSLRDRLGCANWSFEAQARHFNLSPPLYSPFARHSIAGMVLAGQQDCWRAVRASAQVGPFLSETSRIADYGLRSHNWKQI